MISVVIYAAPAIIRSGLEMLIRGFADIDVAGAYGAPDGLEEYQAQAVVWIVYAPKVDTLDELIPFLNPRAALLVVHEGGNAIPAVPHDLVRAWGIVEVTTSPQALSLAIQALSEGLLVFTPGEYDSARSTGERESEALIESLTERELDVLTEIANGLANKQIALKLGISENTVKFHLTSVYSKLNAGNRTEAVRKGARLGLIAL